MTDVKAAGCCSIVNFRAKTDSVIRKGTNDVFKTLELSRALTTTPDPSRMAQVDTGQRQPFSLRTRTRQLCRTHIPYPITSDAAAFSPMILPSPMKTTITRTQRFTLRSSRSFTSQNFRKSVNALSLSPFWLDLLPDIWNTTDASWLLHTVSIGSADVTRSTLYGLMLLLLLLLDLA